MKKSFSLLILLTLTIIALSACQQNDTSPATPATANTVSRALSAVLQETKAKQLNLTQAIFYADNTAIFIAQDPADAANAKHYHLNQGQITKITPFHIQTNAPNYFASSLIRPSIITEVSAEAIKRTGITTGKISQITIFKDPGNPNQTVISLTVVGEKQSKTVTADIAGNILSIS